MSEDERLDAWEPSPEGSRESDAGPEDHGEGDGPVPPAENPRLYPAPPLRLVSASGAPGCGVTMGAFAVGFLFMLASVAVTEIFALDPSRMLLLMQVALVAGVASFLLLTGYPLREAFRVRPVPLALVPLALQLGVALIVANLAATLVLGPSARDIELVTGDMGTWDRVLLSFTVALVAPLVEESLFRGLVQGALEARVRHWVAIALAAVPFALLHGWPGMLFFLVWSLPLGWVTWRAASIVPAVLVHAVNNLVGVIALFAAGPVDPEALERGIEHYLIAAAILALAAGWTVQLCAKLDRTLNDRGRPAEGGVARNPGA